MNEPLLNLGPRQRMAPALGLENSAYLKKYSNKQKNNLQRKNATEDFRKTLKLARFICVVVCFSAILNWDKQTSLANRFPEPESIAKVASRDEAPVTRRRLPPPRIRHDTGRPNTMQNNVAKPVMKKKKFSGLRVRRNAMKPTRKYNPNPSIVIPPNLEALLSDIKEPMSKSHVPIFWHILKSGGTTVKDAAGVCLRKVEASESGVLDNHGKDQSIQKVRISNGMIEYANGENT